MRLCAEALGAERYPECGVSPLAGFKQSVRFGVQGRRRPSFECEKSDPARAGGRLPATRGATGVRYEHGC